MNQLFLFLTATLALGLGANSQSLYGLKVGFNLADQDKAISPPQAPSIKPSTRSYAGYQLGAFYKTTLHNRFMVAAEANFSVVGSSMTLSTSDNETYKAHEKLGYIEIPLALQYKLDRVYFGVGPSMGFKVFSKITNVENRSFDIPYYKNIDAAANVLAGCSVSKKLDVNIRYSHGLVNLYKDPGYAEVSNRFFNLSLLYAFR